MRFNYRHFYAILQARLREFYRDRASWAWNLLMPFFIIIGFAFIFSGTPDNQFKVAVLDVAVEDSDLAFFKIPHIQFVTVEDLPQSIIAIQRHQFDLLLDTTQTPPHYWVNNFSSKGLMAEKVMLQSFSTPVEGLVKEQVSGQAIRYVDWLIPGVLAMNMMFSCLWGVGWVVVRYRKNGVLRRLQATPLTPLEFLSAQVVARLLIVMMVTSMVYVGAYLLLDFPMRGSYLALFLVLVSGATCLISLGLIVATRLKTEEVADGLLNLMSWPMMIFSGIWFSLEGAHPAAKGIAQIFPLTHMVDAARKVMIDGADVSGVAFEIGLLMLFAVVLLTVSARLFRWS